MRLIVSFLREPRGTGYSSYGYELYLPNAIADYVLKRDGAQGRYPEPEIRALSPIFYAAGWELCRRGVLRPGICEFGRQVVDEGSGGAGFTVTPSGKAWLAEGGHDEFFTTDPERFARMLGPFEKRLGQGFRQRGQEASRCYFAHAYLACCAMCGAAAESVLLAAATAKRGGEEAVLKEYRTASGRRRVQDSLIGKARKEIAQPFANMMGLLSYWRDDAAHGGLSPISELEAHEALTRLLRLANFVNDNWKELTRQP
jgi:hypothetical protein